MPLPQFGESYQIPGGKRVVVEIRKVNPRAFGDSGRVFWVVTIDGSATDAYPTRRAAQSAITQLLSEV